MEKVEMIVYLGKEYKSFAQLCRAYNKVPATVRYRMDHGENLTEALFRPIKEKKDIVNRIGNTKI